MMPTSVPGRSSGLAKTWRLVSARSGKGFTLIELLVVLLVMGLTAGLVGSIARPDDAARLRVEADRLGQLLALAATESRLTGAPIAWTSESHGYRFWRSVGDGTASAEWSEMADSDGLRARSLPQGIMIVSLLVENRPTTGLMRLEFSPYTPAPSFTIGVALGAARYLVAASPLGEIQVGPDGRGDHAGPAQH